MQQLSLFKKSPSNDWKWKLKDIETIPKNGLKVFSCFACGGGSTMGYKLAGYDVIGCCEIDYRMNEIYVKNHKPKYNFLMDIREFNHIEKLPAELHNLDILDGSPPCTTFSISGDREKSWGKKKKFREGQNEQTLDDLSYIFIETVEKLRPKVVIMENVEGLLQGEAWGYVQKIHKKFHDIGYHVQHFLMKGENMGIPQKRHRVFFIANRIGKEYINMAFDYEPVTYGMIKDGNGENTTGKIYKILTEAKPAESDLVRAWNRLYNPGGKEKRMYFNHILWKDDAIPSTIPAGHSCLYDFENKKSVSKMDLIHAQTFPEDFNFIKNTFSNINYVCGMSVPPVMMKRVAMEVYRQWLNVKR